MDCGPSCLKMIAEYYGRNYSLRTLRQLCFISKEGVSLFGISKAAESIGFHTIGGRFTFEKIFEHQPLPCIIHWNQNHFIVLYKIKKKGTNLCIHVADPGKGLLKYSKEEFISGWISTINKGEEKGVALLLEPTNAFYEREDEKSKVGQRRFRFLANYFLRYKNLFGQLILGLLVGSLIQLIFPFLTQAIVDKGIANQNINFIWLILIAQLMLLLGRTSIDFFRRRILLHISARINISLLSDFFIKLMRLPMSFFDTKLIGDILQRIEDHKRIENFITSQLNINQGYWDQQELSFLKKVY